MLETLQKKEVLFMEKSSLQGVNQQATNLAWLAGIIDGEGTITVRRNGQWGGHERKGNWRIVQVRPEISICNSNPVIINQALHILNSINVGSNTQEITLEKENHKTYWIIHITGLKRCKTLIDEIIPYLYGKKAQAELLNKFYETRIAKKNLSIEERRYSEEDLQIANKIRSLNDYTRNSKGDLLVA